MNRAPVGGGDVSPDAVAIIGMAGRFPGARNVDEFWRNLCLGVESVTTFTPEELAASGVDPGVLREPEYVPAGAPLEGADLFDAAFFGMTPREAELMDPQQRLFLECAWAALEDAGRDPQRCVGAVGVFGGVGRNTYFIQNVGAYRDLMDGGAVYEAMLGSEKDFVATRVSYKLNLRGPAVTVQSACSTSGVAIHLACQSLLSGECDIALAGGARVMVPLRGGYRYVEGGIASPDGHCRAFDAKAQGCVYGSGGAVIVLRRLADAVADRDNVIAVIRATAINNDGSGKVGFTAPSVIGQAAVIEEALAMAGVSADTIGYVEAHGTGTRIGDPIEIAALTRAYRKTTDRSGYCAIGSLKANVGHLDAGAAVAGVIKAALVLKHGQIPPSVNFERPNPEIGFVASPFYVNTELQGWPSASTPRRAGVSSFGLGGTNAHIVLEEAPSVPVESRRRSSQLLVLSAKSPSALDAMTRELSIHLKANPDVVLADVAYTLAVGRRPFPHRRVVVCRDVEDAIRSLERQDPHHLLSGTLPEGDAAAAFMFPGGGAQYPDMGLELYKELPVFREELDGCLKLLDSELSRAVRAALFPTAGSEAQSFDRPALALPALVAVEYALAKVWISWGVQPTAMIGHSQGEYTAACLAGVMSLRDALEVAAVRGRLFERLPVGAMLSVALPEEVVTALLVDGTSVAALNAPSNCVVSGAMDAIDRMERALAARGIDCRRIHIAVAAHSPAVEPILGEFEAFVRQLHLEPPRIPYVSNVTGTWIRAEEATDPGYWARHLRLPVRFSTGVATLLAAGSRVLIEAGPGQALSTFVRQHPARTPAHPVLPSLRHPKEEISDEVFLMTSLARSWLAGMAPDWDAVHAGQGRRVRLPGYPFERKRYWLEAGSSATAEPGPRVTPVAPEEGDKRSEYGEGASIVEKQPTSGDDHRARILGRLKEIFHDLSGVDVKKLDEHASFLEQGFDSLFLTRANMALQRELGVKTTFRQFFDETPTLEALACYLEAQLPADAFAAGGTESPSEGHPGDGGDIGEVERVLARQQEAIVATGRAAEQGSVERVLAEQLRIMSQQLELLRGRAAAAAPRAPASGPVPGAKVAGEGDGTGAAESRSFGPWKPIDRGTDPAWTQRQRDHVAALTARLTARTRESKRLTQHHRTHLADPRTVAGFRRSWKELVYPVVAARSAGSRIWDVDGNEYVDIAMGFGVNLFGHSPPFITDVVRDQLAKGVEIGPQSPLAGQVAQLVSEFTGMERVAFCNTGSEAVLAALRIARTVTGRTRIATFAGDYHGIFDEVLATAVGVNGKRQTVPIAPGIPPRMVEGVVVLDYGDPQSLDVIRRQAGELAAVLVEPVQSRHPDLQPREFLHALRELTAAIGVPLIFDEMITGFRSHPGGVQALFGVRADIATYGKVVGGGFPIGVVAGTSRYMDALDGGMWSFGDDSFPETGVTWFAGTFVRHPVALAASLASLSHMRQCGPGLQAQLNERTAAFVERLNAFFADTGAPLWLEHFSSLFHLKLLSHQEHAGLLYYHLRDKGVHVTEGRAAFFSTAHTDEDIELVGRAFKESVAEMQASGLLPRRQPSLVAATRIEPAESGSREAPLTEAQQEIWLAATLNRDAECAFNLSNTLRLSGPLDVDALRRALQALVARHEALRTTISADGAMQHVAPTVALDVPLVDLADLDDDRRRSAFADLRAREVETPFDLLAGPLVRATLIRLRPTEHELFLTVHHIICDGWSCGVLLRDLGVLYSALSQGREPELKEPMQLSEYARREADASENAERATTEAYWLSQFADGVPTLDLPTDRARPPVKTYRATRQELALEEVLGQELKRAAAREGCTLFTMLLAAFQAFVYRLTGQAEFVVGISAAGQAAIGNRDLVGHCVNLLPLWARVDGDAPFKKHLLVTKRALLDAFEHQNYTFGTLVRGLRLRRDPSRLPVLSVVFNMDSAMRGLMFSGLEVEPGSNPRSRENFDLFVNVVQTGRGLGIECTYNTDLFEAATIRRRLEEFRTLLAGMAADSERVISRLSLMPETERRRLLVEWNDTRAVFAGECCVHKLFEAQARRTPDALAVTARGDRLDYGALDRRASRLAHYLRKLGVGPDVTVAVCLERSVDMVVASLAILKAGGAYVPLDPSYPPERLAWIIEDAGAPVLIVPEHLGTLLRVRGVAQVCPDRDRERIGVESPAAPVSGVRPENLAYVIYTSGSTGKPKGVEIRHAGLVNLICWHQRAYDITARDRASQLAAPTFDASVWELWPYLTAGASVHLSDIAQQGSPADVLAWLAGERITVCFLPTPLAEAALTESLPKGLVLRHLLTGGDRLRRRPPRGLPFRVTNHYGPTESTVVATAAPIESGDHDGAPPIGRPIANTRVYVLDANLEPMPIGVPGELCLAGVGLARGYLNRSDLTAEKFVIAPFAEEPDRLLYRTGDLVRYRPDGALEFLGRIDRQVKIRGFRIEPGEIEAVLTENLAVREAVVVVREDRPGDLRLVAYWVPSALDGASPVELRAFLRERLPAYMIPQHFVRLQALPCSPSGKVDRRALPPPEQEVQVPGDGFVAPRSATELVLAEIWREALAVERVGTYDNFFDLGGHSLLAVRVIARMHEATGYVFSLIDLARQTVGQLAAACDASGAGVEGTGPRPVVQRAVQAFKAKAQG